MLSIAKTKDGSKAMDGHLSSSAIVQSFFLDNWIKKLGPKYLEGGPGSGCHGDNCGRKPTSGGGSDEKKFDKSPDDLKQYGYKNQSTGLTSVSEKMPDGPDTALVAYAEDKYEGINKDLRSGKISPGNKEYIEDIDQAFQVSALNQPTKLYRGVKPEDGFDVSKIKVGQEISDPAFMSTSPSKDIAKSFASAWASKSSGLAGAVFEIDCKAGQPAVDLTPLKSGVTEGEKEILLPRNTKLEVTGERQEGSVKVFSVKIKNHEAKESKKKEAAMKPTAKNDGIFGPAAFLDQWISKVSPKSYKPEGVVMEDTPQPATVGPDPAETYLNKLISENPQMSAAAFLALMKSKGVKFALSAPPQKQADSSSSMVQMTRESNKRLRESITFRSARFLEAIGTNGKPDAAYTRFKTVLLAEGLGNLRDTYYYSRQALESAIPVFEGSKIYADHPSAIDEQVRPERSVRDILGHFENVHMEEGEDGQALLIGDVVIPPDEPFVWARSLMGHAVDFAKKYPAKDFVGLSINASGDATPVAIDQLIEQGVPQSALIKLQKAKELGNETVKIVSVIAEATSCDLVTEAGAGGKILQLLEGDIKMAKKEAEAKESEMEKKEDMASDKEEIPSSDDTMDAGHDDQAQDIELIKKMIAKYLSADEMANEEECGMVKQAYEACKEMGMDEGEAAKHAVTQLKMAKHMAAKQAKEAVDVDAEKGVVGGGPAEAEPMMQAEGEKEMEAHKESAVVTLTAKVAKLEQELKSYKTREHLDKILEASKLPKQATNKFRDLVKDARTTQEIDKLFKVYEAAFKDSKPAVGTALNLEGVFVQAEKTTTTTKSAAGKGLDLDGVFRD